MEELKKQYNEKNEAFNKKYADEIYQIAMNNGVDLGIGADMLKAIARGNEEYGLGVAIDMEELKQDWLELRLLSKKIAQTQKVYQEIVEEAGK